jgi:hypothetical protein
MFFHGSILLMRSLGETAKYLLILVGSHRLGEFLCSCGDRLLEVGAKNSKGNQLNNL